MSRKKCNRHFFPIREENGRVIVEPCDCGKDPNPKRPKK